MTAANSLPLPVMKDDEGSADCRWEVWALVLLGVICVAPVWAFTYFPSTDGGAHLANADVLLQYLKPAGAAYRKYYELSRRPLPNSLGHFLLAGLMLLVKPTVAEKLLVSGYVIGLPLAVRYALRAVRPGAGFLAFAVVPLSLNWILHQGFYNFCVSVIAFFVLMGYWLRRRERMTFRSAVVLGVLGLVLYAGHLLSIALACAAVFILASYYTLAAWWAARRERAAGGTPPPLWPGVRSRVIVTFAALLPAIALFAWFQLGGFAGKPDKLKLALVNREFWRNLAGLSILISYRPRPERWMARGTAVLFLFLLTCTLLRKRHRAAWSGNDGLLLVPLAFVALYFTRGDPASAKLFIPERLVYYTYLTLLPFLAAQRWCHRTRVVVATVAGGLAIAITASHVGPFRAFNEQLAEFVSAAERVDPQSTVLPLIMAPRGSPAVSDPLRQTIVPFYTAAGYAAIERKSVDLRNYEAGLDYFPVRFRAPLNPYKHLAVDAPLRPGGLDDVPQRVDIPGYESRTPGRVDWVVVWGPIVTFNDPKQAAWAAETMRQVREGFDLVYTSPQGRAQVWKRRQ